MAAVVEGRSDATRRHHIWRAEAAMGAVIRGALTHAGVELAGATRLCLAEEADAALAALPDTSELQRADADGMAPADAALADAFTTKILALARRVAGRPPPDFANLSFAELFAWSLAWPAAS